MLNCSYNLGMRHLKGYIPEYPIGTADEIADKMIEFVPIARTLLGVRDLKIITFGPRPQKATYFLLPLCASAQSSRVSSN